jgi:hypothetical protein
VIPKLEKALRRELELDGQPYVVTLSPDGVRIIPKGKRVGAREITWVELVSGEAQLHRDLVRSLAHRKPPTPAVPPGMETRRRTRWQEAT